MASRAEWVEALRLRTLPAAVAPVLVGSAVAWDEGGFSLVRMLLAMVVALLLQIGVNFANDYSDGIRGSDDDRVGPQRLVGSGAAKPGEVKAAAFGSFGIAALAGLILVALCGQWWLLLVGVACIVAAWFYTGGKHPYGYMGLGEVFVFIFFGLVATVGTTYTQLLRAPAASWIGAVAIGSVACAVLVCNNLRDLPKDVKAGKRTLATRLGDKGTRWFYVALVIVTLGGIVVLAAMTNWWVLLGAAGAAWFLIPAARLVLAGTKGMALVKVLKSAGLGELAAGVGVFVGALL